MYQRIDRREDIKTAGFDSFKEGKKLTEYYLEILK